MRLMRWTVAVIMAVWLAGVGARWGWAQIQAPAQGQAPASQDKPADITSDIELTRAVIQARRQLLVTAAMDLEPKEAESFWPLYRDYRVEMAKVNDRFVKLFVTYMENYENVSDQLAGELLDGYLGIEKDRTSVKTKYVPRFRKVLPAKKVARFFQVDHKLDVMILAELAEDVPLVR